MKYDHSEVNMVGCGALRNSNDAKEITYEQGGGDIQAELQDVRRRGYRRHSAIQD